MKDIETPTFDVVAYFGLPVSVVAALPPHVVPPDLPRRPIQPKDLAKPDAQLVSARTLIVCPAIGRDIDVFEAATELHAAGFAGQLVAVGHAPLNPDMLRAEILQVAPGLRVEIVVFDAPTSLLVV